MNDRENKGWKKTNHIVCYKEESIDELVWRGALLCSVSEARGQWWWWCVLVRLLNPFVPATHIKWFGVVILYIKVVMSIQKSCCKVHNFLILILF